MTLTADFISLLFLLGVLALAAVLILHRHPRLGFLVWLLTLVTIPSWVTSNLVLGTQPAALVGAMVAFSLLPMTIEQLSLADVAIFAVLVMCLVSSLVLPSTADAPLRVVTLWLVGYVLGRLMPLKVSIDWIFRCLGVVFTLVALGGLAEFATGQNPFLALRFSNSAFTNWGHQEFRGGLLRIEGAFGHPLAFGASMALMVPLVATCSYRFAVRLGMITVMIMSIVVTFSRTALLCAVLGLLLVFFSRRNAITTAQRAVTALLVLGLGVAVTPFVLRVFRTAGEEATESGKYRAWLLETLPSVRILGVSESFQQATNGVVRFGGFRSIDNAILQVGLTYGALPLILIGALLIYACLQVVKRSATPTVTALVAHIPALLTVALITQYTMVLWFVIGLAVAQQLAVTRAESLSPLMPSLLTSSPPHLSPPHLSPPNVSGPNRSKEPLHAVH